MFSNEMFYFKNENWLFHFSIMKKLVFENSIPSYVSLSYFPFFFFYLEKYRKLNF